MKNNLVVENTESQPSVLDIMSKKRLESKKLLDSLQDIVNKLVEAKNIDNKLNIESHAKIVCTLLYIANKTKHKSLKKICLEALDDADKESLGEMATYYRQQGIEFAMTEIKNKIEFARSLNSDLSALVGESYYEHLKKLL